MSGATASPNRRGARAVLCAALALAGMAAVLAVAGREPARHDTARAAGLAVSARPAVVASPGGTRVEERRVWPSPAVAPVRERAEPPASAVRVDLPSFDGSARGERVASALGRVATEGPPLDAGAYHTHLTPADAAGPETAAPGLAMGATASGTVDGWDGGAFWFSPRGLVRMKEAQP